MQVSTESELFYSFAHFWYTHLMILGAEHIRSISWDSLGYCKYYSSDIHQMKVVILATPNQKINTMHPVIYFNSEGSDI